MKDVLQNEPMSVTFGDKLEVKTSKKGETFFLSFHGMQVAWSHLVAISGNTVTWALTCLQYS